MNKKTWLAYIVLIGCIALLAGSYIQWKDKLASFNDRSSTVQREEPVKKDVEPVEDMEPQIDKERLLSLITNQDEQVQEVFRNRLEAEKQLNFLIVGSESMNAGDPGYADHLNTALKAAYGDFIQVTIASIAGTSEEFINEGIETELDLTNDYDLVLFEPFTLNNNGWVVIEDEHRHINAFREELASHVEDAVVVLHPPQPIHLATYYPTQVSALQLFASVENIPYIDHWADWPDTESDELPQFLNEESVPNSEGAEIWANALITYFIAK